MEMSSCSHNLLDNKTATVYTLVNFTPTKNGMTRTRKESQPEPAHMPDKQISALKQHVQILELKMAASECVCRHLESLTWDMTANLENSDGSKHFLHECALQRRMHASQNYSKRKFKLVIRLKWRRWMVSKLCGARCNK